MKLVDKYKASMFSGAESSNPYGLRDGEVSSGVSDYRVD